MMRETTRAIVLVELVIRQTKDNAQVQQDLEDLKTILVDSDARTGRRDPSKRKRAEPK